MRWTERLRPLALPLLYLVIVAWLNVYLCREMFTAPENGRMNSMHGFWMSLARLAHESWFKPSWWPFWDGGMPFEFTYMPLLPGLTALLAKVTGSSIALAYNRVAGFAYCLVPVTVFIACWRMTRAAGASFAAAIVFSLTTPAALLAPDGPFRWSGFWDARRLFLTVVWDEASHILALAIFPLLILFLARAFETRRLVYYWAAGIAVVLMTLASVFGPVLVGITAICLLFSLERDQWLSNLGLTLGIGALAYIAVSPYLPPSLIALIRADQANFADSAWTVSSWTALAATVLAWTLVWPLVRRAPDWPLRFFALFAVTVCAVSLLWAYGSRHFLPQPQRYRVEMDLGLIVVAVFSAHLLWRRVPRSMRAGILLVLVALAAEQTVAVRKYAKGVLAPSDIPKTIEYRAAQWVAKNLPETRVFMGGSLGGGWLNNFTDAVQFAGSSPTIAPNQVQHNALTTMDWALKANPHDGKIGETWLQAYGVGAVGVPGPDSPEYWKPFVAPRMFEGVLPVLWREQDTTIYQVPQLSPSLAHVIPSAAAIKDAPRDGFDLNEVQRYVSAIEDPALPLAEMRWDRYNRAVIQATVKPGELVSVQVNAHPGWHATAHGQNVRITKDGLGLMLLHPSCDGPCEIDLRYDGGWELKLLRILSPLELILLIGWSLKRR